jgi:hypothetical protein
MDEVYKLMLNELDELGNVEQDCIQLDADYFIEEPSKQQFIAMLLFNQKIEIIALSMLFISHLSVLLLLCIC